MTARPDLLERQLRASVELRELRRQRDEARALVTRYFLAGDPSEQWKIDLDVGPLIDAWDAETESEANHE